ncbi:NAD(P)-dependent oxidoreductase [Candidatus Pelagibacter sp.]|jgi:nucleoside-diphosphate-sugar epimerase|nr:NAD(P)-dependent oxidoreductase [Candidatus Pelagibacter sp.]
MKKILITGSSGFLGNNLSNFFSQNNYKKFKVVASYNSRNPKFKKKIKTIKLNSKILKKKKKMNFDIVIHCASKTRVNTANNFALYKENIEFLNQIIKKVNFNYFFFMSSVSVYGLVNDKKIKESTILGAQDFYGKSKIKCEAILKKFSLKNPDKRIVIFRLPGVVGLNSHSNFISNLKKAFEKNLDNKITINNQNDKFNNILHVKDLYFFITKILTIKYKFNIIVFVLGSKYSIKLKNVVKIFENFYKKKIKLKFNTNKNHNKLIDFSKGAKFDLKFNSTIKSIKLMLNNN